MIYKITIQDEQGKPIPGAAVRFVQGSTVLVTMVAGANGVVTLDSETDSDLLGDAVSVRASAAGYNDSGITGNALLPDWTFTMQAKPPYAKYIAIGAGGGLLLAWILRAGSGKKVGGFFDGMSTGAKLAVLGAGGLAAYLLFFRSAGIPNTDLSATAAGDLTTLHNSGVDPTISASEADAYSSELVAAFDGCGTDEDAVYNVFRNMRNKSDVLLLISTYGVRSYGGCFDGPIYKDNVDYNLGQSLSSELGASELAKVNDILKGNGIDFSF